MNRKQTALLRKFAENVRLGKSNDQEREALANFKAEKQAKQLATITRSKAEGERIRKEKELNNE